LSLLKPALAPIVRGKFAARVLDSAFSLTRPSPTLLPRREMLDPPLWL
jgi:hypothetical protein